MIHVRKTQHWTYCGKKIRILREGDSVISPAEMADRIRKEHQRIREGEDVFPSGCPRCRSEWREDPLRTD